MSYPGNHLFPEEASVPRSQHARAPIRQIPAIKESLAYQDRIKVLIADDQQIACEVLRRLLRHEASVHVVATCHTGPETLEAIKQLNPDLVFLDVQMPGMNGFEVLDRLPENRKPMVIFVTANPSFESRASRAQAGFLLKPCTRDRIQNALRRAVERRKPSGKELNF